MESKQIDVEGIRMRWEEQGEGEPVVFVHGIPTNPQVWRHVIPRIDGARCMAWEMVGFGASIDQGVGRDLSVAKQADYLAGWMRAVGLDGATLVGHDLGGGVVHILAARRPELVRGLVIADAVCYDNWPILPLRVMRVAAPLVERLPEPVLRFLVWGLVIRLGHGDRRCAKESLRIHWAHYARGDAGAALVRQIRHLDNRDTRAVADQIPHLKVPARLVWGAKDPWLDIGYGYRMAYELGVTIDRVDDGKHFVPEDQAQRVAQAVSDLLGELARTGGKSAMDSFRAPPHSQTS